MTQETLWLTGGRESMVAEIAEFPGAHPHWSWACKSQIHKSQVHKESGPLTRSFPLAMDRESGECPLHNMFGFALCERRSRTMSLAHCGKKGRST